VSDCEALNRPSSGTLAGYTIRTMNERLDAELERRGHGDL